MAVLMPTTNDAGGIRHRPRKNPRSPQPRGGRARFLVAPSTEDATMPAKSQRQQKAAGAALSAKRGETPKSALKGASREMADSMTEAELERMASVSRKTLPKRAAKP
jgi:hypothetical protein